MFVKNCQIFKTGQICQELSPQSPRSNNSIEIAFLPFMVTVTKSKMDLFPNRTQTGSPISETQLESHKKKFLLGIDCH